MDAVQRYKMFLRWARGNSIIEKEDGDDNGDEPKRKRQRKEDNVEVRGCRGYKMAKIPGYGNKTVDALVNQFHAANEHFLWCLEEFLLMHLLSIPPSHDVPFGVFKCLSVMLPQIPQVADLTNCKDTIQTILPKPPQGRRKAVSAQFDTTLAFEKAGLTAFSDPLNPLKGEHLVFFSTHFG